MPSLRVPLHLLEYRNYLDTNGFLYHPVSYHSEKEVLSFFQKYLFYKQVFLQIFVMKFFIEFLMIPEMKTWTSPDFSRYESLHIHIFQVLQQMPYRDREILYLLKALPVKMLEQRTFLYLKILSFAKNLLPAQKTFHSNLPKLFLIHTHRHTEVPKHLLLFYF